MRRRPRVPAETKTRIVLRVLAGETTIAEAARQEYVSEQSVGNWKAIFLSGGRAALTAGGTGLSRREEHLEAVIDDLTGALGRAAFKIDVLER